MPDKQLTADKDGNYAITKEYVDGLLRAYQSIITPGIARQEFERYKKERFTPCQV